MATLAVLAKTCWLVRESHSQQAMTKIEASGVLTSGELALGAAISTNIAGKRSNFCFVLQAQCPL
jgi:hypothetical protein